jgi:hypothetical protein
LLDRVHLLSRPEARPLQSFGTETAVDSGDYLPRTRHNKHVSFDPYDQTRLIRESHDSDYKRDEWLIPTSNRLDLWTTVIMSCLLVIGIGCGVAHHAFNAYLNDRPLTSFDQTWAIRIGTALAMGFKTAVIASMGMAFAQRMWRSVRHQAMSVKSLDSLFGAFSGDPRSLFQGDLYRSAILALLIAVSSWILPLATVFTPATLRVKPADRTSSTSCIVPGVNLRNGTDGGSIRYPSSNGLYTGPAPMIQRFAVQSLMTGSFNPFPYTSGLVTGANTSYTLSFTAPALQCSEANSTAQSNLPQNTYWSSIRSPMHDSVTGQDIPTLKIQYASTPNPSSQTILTCVPYLADYGVLVTYNSTAQSVALLNMTMTAPAGRPTGGSGIQLSDANALTTGAAAIVDATFNTLVGNLTRDQNGNLLTSASNVALASFVHMSGQSACDFKLVRESVEQLMRDVSASAMGLRLVQTQATCVTVDRVNVYLYDQGVLIASYLAAVAVAIAAVAVGLHALKANGHSGDTSFSGVVLSTRNPTLDRACEDGRESLLALRVRFGRLSNGRPAFGIDDDFLR